MVQLLCEHSHQQGGYHQARHRQGPQNDPGMEDQILPSKKGKRQTIRKKQWEDAGIKWSHLQLSLKTAKMKKRKNF